VVKVGNLARRADLRPELEALRDSGLPITILWGARDKVVLELLVDTRES